MIHEATRYTRYQSYIQHKSDTIEMNRKLYLRTALLINYMMEKNLFFYEEWSPAKHATSCFFVGKISQKKEEKKRKKERKWQLGGLVSQVQVLPAFLSKGLIYYSILILHKTIKLLNFISTNSFSWESNFTFPTRWWTNELRDG